MSARARLLACVVGGVVAAGCALAAHAAPAPGALVLDRVRADGRRFDAWVTVLDDAGLPLVDAGGQTFTVELDGRRLAPPVVVPAATWAPDVTLLVDPGLVGQPGVSPVELGGATLLRAAGDAARVRIAWMTPGADAVEGRGDALVPQLEPLARRRGDDRRARLYDVLAGALAALQRGPARAQRTLVVLARGNDEGSRATAADVFGRADAGDVRVPVAIVLVGTPDALAVTRLRQIAERSGGGLFQVEHWGDLERAMPAALARGGAAVHLRFDAPGVREAATHDLVVSVASGASTRAASRRLFADQVAPPPWRRGPVLALALAALAVVVALAALAARPRRRFTLVVGRDPGRGTTFEVYALPVTIGALDTNDIVWPADGVSRNHALIERRGAHVEIVDQNSQFGTFVNERKTPRAPLTHGDIVRLGGTLEFEIRFRR